MRRLGVVLAVTLFPVSLVSLATRSALADEPDAEAPPPAAAPARAPVEEAPELKSFVILANPLALTIGRFSIQAEYLPAVHHAITLNPVYTHAPVTVTVDGEEIDAGSLNGFGGELGYKFY